MIVNPVEATRLLEAGKVIAIPTETVWGLAARADDPTAVSGLRQLKGREAEKPLTLFPQSAGRIGEFALITPGYEKLVEAGLVPGPLTIILESRVSWEGVPAGDGSLGIRIPKHRETMRLLAEAGFPLATTSANPAGLEPARNLKELIAYFPALPALRGECGGQLPSSVIDARAEPLVLLRRGSLGLREIELAAEMEVVSGELRVLFVCTGGVDRSPASARWIMAQGIEGLEARFAGILWPEGEILSAACWADLIFPLEGRHAEFLVDLGVCPAKVMPPLGIPDPHDQEESLRKAIFVRLEGALAELVLPEIRARLRA